MVYLIIISVHYKQAVKQWECRHFPPPSDKSTSIQIQIVHYSAISYYYVMSDSLDTYLTPCSNKNPMNPWRPPGLSSTRTVSLTNLPSAARPRSRHLPNNVVSILPPHSNTTILKENNTAFMYYIVSITIIIYYT